jgi:hypothetical protein
VCGLFFLLAGTGSRPRKRMDDADGKEYGRSLIAVSLVAFVIILGGALGPSSCLRHCCRGSSRKASARH